ncbi:MAG: tripartite tricarboxylate transporter substrate-binding protein [Alphaproteobacteria bacterium]|nr:tripartite tricarboxylate transporter substrate-binding protein [Alphaproteobacteria bacterium]
MRRRLFTQSLAAGLALPQVSSLWAQSQTIKLVVGFAAGGSVDLTARAMAESMRETLGRSVLVENRPGASGRFAPETIRQARPDGDTLMLVPHGPMTLFQWLHLQLRYDAVKDFTPIGRVCVVDYALTTGPATPAKTVGEYLQWAQNPAHKAAYGSPGAGTIPHFIGQGLMQKTRTDMVHVPYKGSALTMVDLMAGNLSLGVSPLPDAVEHHRNGRVRVLATTGSQRNPVLPEIPTLRESGIDLVVDGWYGIYGPAGMADASLQSLTRALEMAVTRQADFFTKNAMRGAYLRPDALAQLQRAEAAQWEPWVKASGFKAED